MPVFHETRFPELIAWGARGGPAFNTTVVQFDSGKEQRNQNWTIGRMEWDVSAGVKTQEDLDELVDFFRARRGQAHGFRYKDWSDYLLKQEVLQNSADDTFVGDGFTVIFNVVRRYEVISPPPSSSDLNKEIRRIFKLRGGAGDPLSPLTPSEIFRVNGSPVTLSSVDRDAGTVTFSTAPPVGQVADITSEFDVPARFDTDKMQIEIVDFNAYTIGGIIIKEINPLLEP